MPIEKEFGKLSANQIRQLLQWLPTLDSLRSELRSSVQGRPDKFERMAPSGITWANLYERKIEEHLAELVIAVGADQFVIEASQADDPTQVLLDSINVDDDDDGLPDLSDDPLAMHRIFGLLYALLNSFECLMVYGYYINELVAMARNGGLEGDKALLNAVRIDPTVIAGPTGSVRLTRAVLFDDVEFLEGYCLAVQGKTGDQAAYLRKFRFVIQLLAESHVIDLPNKALIKLVIDVGAYADTPGSEKNVSELIRKAKKKYAISK
ncbi:MAG: hypothetical protein V4500_05895 [Pseudomonadota bacterium]